MRIVISLVTELTSNKIFEDSEIQLTPHVYRLGKGRFIHSEMLIPHIDTIFRDV